MSRTKDAARLLAELRGLNRARYRIPMASKDVLAVKLFAGHRQGGAGGYDRRMRKAVRRIERTLAWLTPRCPGLEEVTFPLHAGTVKQLSIAGYIAQEGTPTDYVQLVEDPQE